MFRFIVWIPFPCWVSSVEGMALDHFQGCNQSQYGIGYHLEWAEGYQSVCHQRWVGKWWHNNQLEDHIIQFTLITARCLTTALYIIIHHIWSDAIWSVFSRSTLPQVRLGVQEIRKINYMTSSWHTVQLHNDILCPDYQVVQVSLDTLRP